jgi:hypothetical protein
MHRQTVQGERPGIALDVFSLAEKGRKWAISPSGPGLDRSIVFASSGKSNEVVHQVRTNDCYYTLSEHEQATWRIGDQLEIEQGVFRGGRNVAIPDASYKSDTGDEIFVETDCGSYTGRQIEGKVTAFNGHKSIWICPEGRSKTLVRHGVIGEIRTYNI